LASAILAIRRGEVDVDTCRRRGRAYALNHHDRRVVYGRLTEEINGAKSVQGGLGRPVVKVPAGLRRCGEWNVLQEIRW